MIAKIKLRFGDGSEHTQMFGNSYKSWAQQFREYCQIHKPIEMASLESSPSAWVAWGGLKWCSEDSFQEELNREGCQQNDPDNPNSRRYAEMVFGRNPVAENIAKKIVRQVNR